MIEIEDLDVVCQIYFMAIEKLSDVITYSPCNHKFGKEAIVLSCQSMLNEGMTTKVIRCPTCITEFGGKKD